MGNTIVTGSPDFSLDDIHAIWKGQQQQPAAQPKGLFSVPPEVEERFRGITHNLKAFRFCCPPTLPCHKERDWDADSAFLEPLPGLAASADVRHKKYSSLYDKALPHLVVEPLDLGSSNVRLLHTDTCLLINVCRALPSGETGRKGGEGLPGEGGTTPVSSHSSVDDPLPAGRSADPRQGVAAAVASGVGASCSEGWARGMVQLFTPRGLASSVCNNLAGPTAPSACGEGPRAAPSLSTPGFTYSLHVLKGTKACPLGPCAAVLQALMLEEYFSLDICAGQQLLQTLFFNFGRDLLRRKTVHRGGDHNVRGGYSQSSIRNAKPRRIAEELIDWKPSVFGGLSTLSSDRTRDLMNSKEVCERNALLHALHIVRGSYGYDPTLRDRYLRGAPMASVNISCTSLPTIVASGPGRKVHLVAPKRTLNRPQGPPPLEIPRLTLDKIRTIDTVHTAKAPSSENPTGVPSGVVSHSDPVTQSASPSLSARKDNEKGRVRHVDSFQNNESSDSARTPQAPRYIRPLQITTSIPTVKKIRNRRRSLSSKCGGKKQAIDSTTTEIPIPLLSLKNNLATGPNFVGKVNCIGSVEGGHSTDTDDMQDRARRLFRVAPEASEVLPWLFVGGEEPARNRALLLSKGITAVVNTVAFAIPNQFTDVFQYLSLCTSDSPDEPITSLFPIVNRFIDEEHFQNDGKVFIHCQQGVSRSCSFVIAYIMWHYGMCYDRAHELVHAKRGVCSPNAGFYVKLRLWERHLVRPVLNRAYVYAPYTKCFPLPFVFHFALDCNPLSISTTGKDAQNEMSPDFGTRPNIEEENKVLGGFAQIVSKENPRAVLDTRLSYGFIFGQYDTYADGKFPASLETFFQIGSECHDTVAEHARDEWLSFLRYNYYTSKESLSLNNRGEYVRFSPIPGLSTNATSSGTPNTNHGATNVKALELSVPIVKDLSILENRLKKSILDDNKTQDGRQLSVQLRCEKDPRWDALLNQPGLIFEFASDLGRCARLRVAADSRKRIREEELHQYRSSGGRFSTNVFVAERNTSPANQVESGEQDPSRPLLDSTTDINTSGGSNAFSSSSQKSCGGDPPVRRRAVAGEVVVPTLHPVEAKDTTGAGVTVGKEEDQAQQFDIAFVRYPFDTPPVFTVLPALEDLQEDECWAIAVAGNSLLRPNAIYLWLGGDCGYPPEAALELFKSHLVVKPRAALAEEVRCRETDEERYTIRIGEYVMEDVVVRIVHQGEEPDELILFL
ncbi:unnamed protein product [Phytomonas sp. EM1]|nr:unnamed protein product [Phytomonas sp. EM1]|eukprot:CCW63659.1 unnamed protein product [Phytomonas sp. isolate EM1]